LLVGSSTSVGALARLAGKSAFALFYHVNICGQYEVSLIYRFLWP